MRARWVGESARQISGIVGARRSRGGLLPAFEEHLCAVNNVDQHCDDGACSIDHVDR